MLKFDLYRHGVSICLSLSSYSPGLALTGQKPNVLRVLEESLKTSCCGCVGKFDMNQSLQCSQILIAPLRLSGNQRQLPRRFPPILESCHVTTCDVAASQLNMPPECFVLTGCSLVGSVDVILSDTLARSQPRPKTTTEFAFDRSVM